MDDETDTAKKLRAFMGKVFKVKMARDVLRFNPAGEVIAEGSAVMRTFSKHYYAVSSEEVRADGPHHGLPC